MQPRVLVNGPVTRSNAHKALFVGAIEVFGRQVLLHANDEIVKATVLVNVAQTVAEIASVIVNTFACKHQAGCICPGEAVEDEDQEFNWEAIKTCYFLALAKERLEAFGEASHCGDGRWAGHFRVSRFDCCAEDAVAETAVAE